MGLSLNFAAFARLCLYYSGCPSSSPFSCHSSILYSHSSRNSRGGFLGIHCNHYCRSIRIFLVCRPLKWRVRWSDARDGERDSALFCINRYSRGSLRSCSFCSRPSIPYGTGVTARPFRSVSHLCRHLVPSIGSPQFLHRYKMFAVVVVM